MFVFYFYLHILRNAVILHVWCSLAFNAKVVVVRLSYLKTILIGVVAVISLGCENMNLSTKVLVFHLMLKWRSTFRFVVLLWVVNFSTLLIPSSFQKVPNVRKIWKKVQNLQIILFQLLDCLYWNIWRSCWYIICAIIKWIFFT